MPGTCTSGSCQWNRQQKVNLHQATEQNSRRVLFYVYQIVTSMPTATRSIPDEADRQSTQTVPSTLAAQLAPRLSSQGSQAHHLTRETFYQLRQELIGSKYSKTRLDDSVTDVAKLVYIVLKAGLETSTEREYLNNDNFEGQVFDCLDIIVTAVGKAPQSLTEIPDPDIVAEGAHAPLYVWLVIQLIRLLGICDNDKIKKKVSGTFTSIICTQYKHIRIWNDSHSIQGFLRACINGL